MASRPVPAESTVIPRRSSDTAKSKDVAHVVVDHQHFAAGQRIVGPVQAVEHFLLGLGQVGDHAMQEERGLVEQALGRFDVLDHDAAGKRVQLHVFFRGEFAAGEDDHGQILELGRVAELLKTSKPDMSGRRRSSTTQS